MNELPDPPTDEQIDKTKSFYMKQYGWDLTNTEAVECYYSQLHLGSAIYRFNLLKIKYLKKK